jgi:hypothetical protein
VENRNRNIAVHAKPGKNVDSIPKITKAKKGWGKAQVVPRLPSKHKALSLNLSTTKIIN